MATTAGWRAGNDPATDAFLDAALARVSLIEIARHVGVPVKRIGSTYRAPCFIHAGAVNPNVDFNPREHVWYCHKCGQGGNVVTFLQRHPKTASVCRSFPDVLTWLSDMTKVPRPAYRGLDVAAHRAQQAARQDASDALDFALRYYQFARSAMSDAFAAACATIGADVGAAERAGAGFAWAPDRLATNVSKRAPASTWPAFAALGLIAFEGDVATPAGVERARATMKDGLPPGVVWPLANFGALAGFAVYDAAGTRVAVTSPSRGFDPRFGTLTVADALGPSNAPPESAAPPPAASDADTAAAGALDAPSSPPAAKAAGEDPLLRVPAVLWASPADYWRAGAQVPGPQIVPAVRWTDLSRVDWVRRLLRAEQPVGALGADGTVDVWMRPEQLAWVDGCLDPVSPGRAPVHALELAVAADPTLDPEGDIDAVGDVVTRLVLGGWWRQRSTR